MSMALSCRESFRGNGSMYLISQFQQCDFKFIQEKGVAHTAVMRGLLPATGVRVLTKAAKRDQN